MRKTLTHDIHATAIYLDGCGILLMGPAKSGKSDLALRLIIEKGASLVADDVCLLFHSNQGPRIKPLMQGEGFLEVRGLGLVRLTQKEWIREAPLTFVLTLTHHTYIDQEPLQDIWPHAQVPLYPVDPFEASALTKIEILVRRHKEPLPFLWPETPLARAS